MFKNNDAITQRQNYNLNTSKIATKMAAKTAAQNFIWLESKHLLTDFAKFELKV